ncbi:hypothetical protein [Paralcaligenes ginsengisoli]
MTVQKKRMAKKPSKTPFADAMKRNGLASGSETQRRVTKMFKTGDGLEFPVDVPAGSSVDE